MGAKSNRPGVIVLMSRAEEQPEKQGRKECIGNDTYISQMATCDIGMLVSWGEAA
jgi:hypothetical protein